MQKNYPDPNFYQDIPPQSQNHQPGFEYEMNPKPIFEHSLYNKTHRLNQKVAIITGGDSGIGRAVSVAFAIEGASVVIVYYNENQDAIDTKEIIEKNSGVCTLIKGDLSEEKFCIDVIDKTIKQFNHLDILVNNAAYQCSQNDITQIDAKQLERTFKINVFAPFYLIKAAMPHFKAGSSIINTTSVTAYKGSETLLDYSSTKGALTSLTRSLSKGLAPKGIRVNAVAPGPIWTPFIPSTSVADQIPQFGKDTPMGRPGQPVELAGAYVYLASDDASYVSGQTIHVNGGDIVNG
ncbi:MAG: short-chain dehydrogenase [Haloplasmataceae bacterium]|jgi:NAD(P)-dependent dehydrogenase (short-subunit alcohol dehydrogenase family)|nr:short-chain dehydrogenase [Haloplasmataceae bacterium]